MTQESARTVVKDIANRAHQDRRQARSRAGDPGIVEQDRRLEKSAQHHGGITLVGSSGHIADQYAQTTKGLFGMMRGALEI